MVFCSPHRLESAKKSKLDFLFNYIDYTAQIPSSLNQTDFDEDPTKAAANWLAAQGFEANKYTLAGITYTYVFNNKLNNKTSIFYTYLDHYEPRPFNILDEFTNGFGFRTQFDGQWGKVDFSLGSELYKDEYHWSTFQNLFRDNNGNGSLQGDMLSRNREFRSQATIFGTLTYPISKKIAAQVGLNFNKTTYNFRDLFNTGANNTSARRDFEGILLPSFELQYQLKNGQLYANISRGFSNPGLEETLTPDGTINPDIAQEIGTNYELGGQFDLLKGRLQLHSSIYRMAIKNLLVAQRIGEDQFIGTNAGETRHQGLELSANYRTNLTNTLTLEPYISYTLNDHSFIDFVDDGEDFSGNPLTGVPKNRISSGFDIQHAKGFRFNFTHQFTDKIPLTDGNTLDSESFNVFHFQIRYQKQLLQQLHVGIHFGLNNIFDTNYAQSVLINAVGFGGSQPRYFYPGNGRNYYAGLKVQYVL